MSNEFKGSVTLHPAFVSLKASYPELDCMVSSFKRYWKEGYHPHIGRDSILPVPDIYQLNAIGRSHVKPIEFENLSYSSSETCWNHWGSSSANPVIPTSNTFLLYCIDENRNACLISYLDSSDKDSHDIIKQPSFRRDMQLRAEEFFNHKKSSGMPVEEHDQLFSEKWLEDEDSN